MTRLFLVASVALVAGCGLDQGGAFRKAVPSADTVRMRVPGQSQSLSGPGTRRDALEGEISEFYALTRQVTVTVNGGVGATLTLMQKIAEYPPSAVTAHSATWGPHTDPLSPNTWKLTITRNATNDHSYLFEAKGKNEPASAFRVILSGSHVSTGEHLGRGSFLLDWDKAQELPEHGSEVGSVQVTYARLSATDPVQIDAAFDDVRDAETGQLVDVLYRFREQANQGGSLDFQLNKNFVAGSQVEVLTVLSRWTSQGAGRSDVRASGGDLGATPATVNDCWDAQFLSRYRAVSYAPTQGYGQPAACAFSTPEYASR